VTPGYFATMKVPILEGRDFAERDIKPHADVAIVNRSFADHFSPGHSILGKHIGFGGPKSKLNMEIIGVVGDTLVEGPRAGIHRQGYIPNYGKQGVTFYVRTTTSASAIYGLAREAVRQLDSSMPIFGMKTLEGQLDETLLTDRLIALLSAGLASSLPC